MPASEPLRWDMTLPDGQPLRWDMGPEFTWDGSVPAATQTHTPMQQNDISITITPEMEAEVMAAADLLAEKLAAFAITITDDERQSYFKLSDKRLPFHEKCKNYIHQHPALVPGTLNVAQYDKDQAAWDALARIAAKLSTVQQPVTDTQVVVGADLLSGDLAFYNYLPLLARADAPGAEDIHGDLKQTYPGRRGGSPAPTPPPAP